MEDWWLYQWNAASAQRRMLIQFSLSLSLSFFFFLTSIHFIYYLVVVCSYKDFLYPISTILPFESSLKRIEPCLSSRKILSFTLLCGSSFFLEKKIVV